MVKNSGIATTRRSCLPTGRLRSQLRRGRRSATGSRPIRTGPVATCLAASLAAVLAVSPAAPVAGAAGNDAIWRLVTNGSFLPDGPRATVLDAIAAGSGKSWALGGWWQDTADSPPVPTVWTTPDWNQFEGPAWKRASLPRSKGADAAIVTGFARLPGITLAIGASWRGGDVDPALWTSSDRRKWKVFGGKNDRWPGQQYLAGVATTTKRVLAVGIETKGSSRQPLVIGTTRTGFTRLPIGEVRDFISLNSIATDGAKRVVLLGVTGKAGRTTAVAWFSNDGGDTFERSDPLPATGPTDVSAVSFNPDPNVNGFTAFGLEKTAQGTVPVAWGSDDGSGWSRERFDLLDGNANAETPKVGKRVVDVVDASFGVLYDERERETLLVRFLPGQWVTFNVPLPPTSTQSPGPLALNSHGILIAATGSGRPDPAFLDFVRRSWIADPTNGADLSVFPAANGARGASHVLPGRNAFLGLEYPVPVASRDAAGRPGKVENVGARPLSWIPGGGGGNDRNDQSRLRIPLVDDGSLVNAVITDNTGNQERTFAFGAKPRLPWAANAPAYDAAVWEVLPNGDLKEIPTTGLESGASTDLILGATRVRNGWVAVGASGPGEDGTSSPSIWASPDLRQWERQSAQEREAANQEVNAVCTLPNGVPIAVGTDRLGETESVAVAWVPGTDGLWREAAMMPLDENNEPGFALRCASGPRGVVAAGQQGFKPGLWTTSDGRTWTQISLTAPPGQASVTAVRPYSGGYVAAGRVDDGAAGTDLAVWLVPFTGKPTRLPAGKGFSGFSDQYASDVAVRGRQIVIAGSSGEAARVWESGDVLPR